MPGPKKIILIRHAEKPGEHPPPLGVDEEGAVNQHALLVRGWQRAGALVAFFVAPTHKKIATPKTIIAATVCDDPAVDPADAKSLRPVLTVEPLVAKLGAAVTFVNDIPVGQEDAAIAAIKACAGVVLVSWEHKRIPAIAAGLSKSRRSGATASIRSGSWIASATAPTISRSNTKICWPAISPTRAGRQARVKLPRDDAGSVAVTPAAFPSLYSGATRTSTTQTWPLRTWVSASATAGPIRSRVAIGPMPIAP